MLKSTRLYHSSEREESLERLRGWLQPGDTLFTILRHRASSGMTRYISVLKLTTHHPSLRSVRPGEIEIMNLDFNVAKVLDRPRSDRYEGVKCEGAGMDMGFDLVYSLGMYLFPDGFDCIGEGCPSNDHSNGDRNYEPHHHKSGGYALRQSWL